MLGRDEPFPERLYCGIPDADESFPVPVLDQHDIRCFFSWALLILPDVTVYPPNNIEILRPLDEASERVMRRHNRHWLREHAASYPEAPIP